jgi:hypothetical protein
MAQSLRVPNWRDHSRTPLAPRRPRNLRTSQVTWLTQDFKLRRFGNLYIIRLSGGISQCYGDGYP